jgi:hypothetical protein
MSKTAKQVEKWMAGEKVPGNITQVIIQLWPIIKQHQTKYPNDIFWIDMNRSHLIFNKNGKLILERCDPNHSMWKKTPIPINFINNDQQIVDLWKRVTPGSEKAIHIQNLKDVQKMLNIKNKHLNVTLVCVHSYKQHSTKNIGVETLTCYQISVLEDGIYLTE